MRRQRPRAARRRARSASRGCSRRSAPPSGPACRCARCSRRRASTTAPSRSCSPAWTAASRAASSSSYERSLPLAEALRRGRPARLRGQRRPAAAAARLPAAAGRPRLVRDDERQVARRASPCSTSRSTGYQNARAYRFRADEDDPGLPVTRIDPRALMVPPGIPDFMTRRRFARRRPGRRSTRPRVVGLGADRAASRSATDDGATWTDAELGAPPGPARVGAVVVRRGTRRPASTSCAAGRATRRAAASPTRRPGTSAATRTTTSSASRSRSARRGHRPASTTAARRTSSSSTRRPRARAIGRDRPGQRRAGPTAAGARRRSRRRTPRRAARRRAGRACPSRSSGPGRPRPTRAPIMSMKRPGGVTVTRARRLPRAGVPPVVDDPGGDGHAASPAASRPSSSPRR